MSFCSVGGRTFRALRNIPVGHCLHVQYIAFNSFARSFHHGIFFKPSETQIFACGSSEQRLTKTITNLEAYLCPCSGYCVKQLPMGCQPLIAAYLCPCSGYCVKQLPMGCQPLIAAYLCPCSSYCLKQLPMGCQPLIAAYLCPCSNYCLKQLPRGCQPLIEATF